MANGWGVFDLQGNEVFDVDSVVDLNFTNRSKVSTFPVEDGAFASFNKVSDPYAVKLRLAVGGAARIEIFMTALAQEIAQANLYNVVTPRNTYLNMTLECYDFSQAAENGMNLLVAELTFQQVREVAPAYATVALPAPKVKAPGAASKQVNGKAQAQKPTSPPPLTLQNVFDRARND